MKLFILRHGQAVNAQEGVKDFDKKLSENGILQAIKIGDFLKETEINQIICSSAIRTSETEAIVNEFLKIDDVSYVDELYLASSEIIKNTICNLAIEQNILYIGHNFGISDFVSDLSGQSINMSTCMLVELDIQLDNWTLLSNDTGVLKEITEPNQL
jgi:phosphohistidine phosphatase